MGFQTEFWRLHHMTLPELRASPAWPFHEGEFATHGQEMAMIVATNPALLRDTWETVDAWTPGIQACDNGTGATILVEQPLVD